MFPVALLGVFVACLAALLLYGALGVAVALLAWRPVHRAAVVPSSCGANAGLTVLVPSHHEGVAVVDTLRTLLAQDHPGPVTAWVLVQDETDESVAALADAWPGEWKDVPGDSRRRVVHASGAREIVLVLCGVAPKREKLNGVLTYVATPYVAFLDADHRAAPDWLSSALARLRATGARAVQSRRRALSTLRLVQIWDSAENHVGNEALNRVLARFDHTVFFTGTTAVFETALFASRRFGDSITEDTWLTLDLLSSGDWIAYDDASGSYEEVAPELASYVARRRRWAAGHSRAFFTWARALLGRSRPHASRGALFAHGVFYLAPVLVLPMLWAVALHDLVQFARSLAIVCGLLTALLASALVLGVDRRARGLREIAVATLWAAPQAAFAAVYLYAWSGREGYYHLLSFPFERRALPFVGAAVAMPLLAFLLSVRPVGGMPLRRVVIFALTFPLVLSVDMYAALLGLADLVLGRAVWTKVTRENVIAADALPAAMRANLVTARVGVSRLRHLLWIPAVAAVVLLTNDLLARNDCGEVRPFLWAPLIVRPRHPVSLRTVLEKHRRDDDTMEATLVVTVHAEARAAATVSWSLDGAPSVAGATMNVENAESEVRHSETFPLGWTRHRLDVEVRGDAFLCRRGRSFSTEVKELVGQSLVLNGEPFVLKGIIPSFSSSRVGLSYATGLAQIKEVGANAVRVYHAPPAEVLEATEHEQLLIVAQPDRSTWQDADVNSPRDRERLLTRYQELLTATEGFPYLLMDHLGNELELGGPAAHGVPAIRALIQAARGPDGAARRFPLAYSTYSTFVDYPVDVLGVNMLDSGATYWDKALAALHARGKAFYASELGGFVAFSERPPSDLRMARLVAQWRALEDAGGIGAFFFESHDDWAQPVPPGETNDPLSAEQPDDVRGFWDEQNRPKPELRVVRRVFADVTVRVAASSVAPDLTQLEVVVANRRPYALRGVRITVPGRDALDVGDLLPRAERTVTVPVGAAQDLPLVFAYTTHHGLSARSQVTLHVPRAGELPHVLNDDFVESERAGATLRGSIVESRTLDVMLPGDWSGVLVNGALVPRGDGRVRVPIDGPYYDVVSPEISHGDGVWTSWHPGITSGGRWLLRFRLPTTPGELLILSGLGASKVRVRARGKLTDLSVHSYRENLVPLARIGTPGDVVELQIERRDVVYVSAKQSTTKEAIMVDLALPFVFASRRVELQKP